ncbi:MAG TPA: hypothetical protein VHB25_11620 [Gemmatimonadaceae bacterium]|nr:hypothetical protein [Gemmatimonadaceae bacterium]
MRSRRRAFELACRIAAFALLGWLIGTSVFPSRPIGVERARGADVTARLADWTRLPPSTELHVELSAAPAPWVVDWLAALRESGHVVRWTGSPPPAAMLAERVADPEQHVRIGVAAPNGATAAISDDAARIDSLPVATLGATLDAPLVIGNVRATVSGQTMMVAPPPRTVTRAVYVIGAAGWEGKYLASALEERGWPVIARFAVAPGVDVAQGQPVLDTSRVAAVVALDTTVDRLGAALARYVRDGGGLVLAGSAARAVNVRAIAPGAVGPRTRVVVQPAGSVGLGSTGFYPIDSLARDAVPLERRDGGVAIAVRRTAAGRVMQVGYDDTWRWRMAGAEGSVDAHRAWWSRVVASVAYVPGVPVGSVSAAQSAAPLAALVDRLGPAAPARTPQRSAPSPLVIIMIIMIFLCTEWASRRLRSVR